MRAHRRNSISSLFIPYHAISKEKKFEPKSNNNQSYCKIKWATKHAKKKPELIFFLQKKDIHTNFVVLAITLAIGLIHLLCILVKMTCI